jgi:hypothetical protein
VQNARAQDAQFAAVQRQAQQAQNKITELGSWQQKAAAQRAEDEAKAREAGFKTKSDAVWNALLEPLKPSIPQGHERTLQAIRAEASAVVGGDPKAQTHLRRAQAYYTQGSPSQGDREFAAYQARAAKLVSDSAAYHLDVLKNLTHAKRLVDGRKTSRLEIPPGGGSSGNGGRVNLKDMKIADADGAGDAAVALARDRLPHLFGS